MPTQNGTSRYPGADCQRIWATVISRKVTSVHMMNWGSGTVAGLVGFGEAGFRGLYAIGGVRAAYARRGGRDRQLQAPFDRPALMKAQDDAGGEGVAGARGAAYLLPWQPDGALPPGPAA